MNTPVKELPNHLGALTNLEELDVHSLLLEILPAEIIGLPKLKRLTISKRDYPKLSSSIDGPPDAVAIDLMPSRTNP